MKIYSVFLCHIFTMLFFTVNIEETYAQTSTTPSVYHWSDLRGTTWDDIYNNEHKQWTLTFTDSVMTNSTYYSRSGNTHIRPRLYYLANSVPKEFDMSKVGKNTTGRYLIGLSEGRLVYNEILGLTENELRIRQTYYGDTLIFVRRP